MNILFVSSGNKSNDPGKPGAVVYNQGESLKNAGMHVDYFLVKGKGLRGYLKEAKRLRKYIHHMHPDIVHAHYTLSGWIAVLTFSKQPVVLSLMGTDAYGEYIGKDKIIPRSRYLLFLTYMIQPFVRAIICKSKHIQEAVYLKKKSFVIPNGVYLKRILAEKKGFREVLGLKPEKKYILFLGDTRNKRKNYPLLKQAYNILGSENVELITPYPIPHKTVIEYLYSVDVLVVPSFMEGSPNIVKEAMICDCPVVATDVGDVKWLFGDEPGHLISNFKPEDLAEKMQQALEFSEEYGRTNGRNRILELGLDSESVSRRIIGVYKNVTV